VASFDAAAMAPSARQQSETSQTTSTAADFGGDGFGQFGVEVAYRNPGTYGAASRRSVAAAQSRCAPGNDLGGLSFNCMVLSLARLF